MLSDKSGDALIVWLILLRIWAIKSSSYYTWEWVTTLICVFLIGSDSLLLLCSVSQPLIQYMRFRSYQWRIKGKVGFDTKWVQEQSTFLKSGDYVSTGEIVRILLQEWWLD